jgi:hypothetical protein
MEEIPALISWVGNSKNFAPILVLSPRGSGPASRDLPHSARHAAARRSKVVAKAAKAPDSPTI